MILNNLSLKSSQSQERIKILKKDLILNNRKMKNSRSDNNLTHNLINNNKITFEINGVKQYLKALKGIEKKKKFIETEKEKLKILEFKELRALKKRKNSENSNSASDNDKEDINTEGMATVETRKLNIKKKENEGVLIMEGIEDLIPEDLTEDDLYQLVEDALSDNIIEDEENQVPGTITRKQVKSISKLLYKKLKKKKGEHDIDISEYPELKGLNVKIGAGKLTKDVIKKMMYSNKNVDDNQIDTAYNNLTKNNNDIKALTIELMTEENTNNDTDNKNQENNNKEEENKNNDK